MGVRFIFGQAYEKGIILAGISAGANCWLEQGITDPLNAPLYGLDCLGFLSGSFCPHYDGETKRRPAYQRLIHEQKVKSGYGVDDGVAMHFINGALHQIVSSRPSAKAYSVSFHNGVVVEEAMDTCYLGSKC